MCPLWCCFDVEFFVYLIFFFGYVLNIFFLIKNILKVRTTAILLQHLTSLILSTDTLKPLWDWACAGTLTSVDPCRTPAIEPLNLSKSWSSDLETHKWFVFAPLERSLVSTNVTLPIYPIYICRYQSTKVQYMIYNVYFYYYYYH